MEKQDYLTGKMLLKKTTFSKDDVILLEGLLKKYVDKKTSVCRKCKSQIKFALKRLQNFMNGLEFETTQVVNEDIREEIVEEVIDTVEDTTDEVTVNLELENLKSSELRELCNKLNLDTSREKEVMITRIKEYYETKS